MTWSKPVSRRRPARGSPRSSRRSEILINIGVGSGCRTRISHHNFASVTFQSQGTSDQSCLGSGATGRDPRPEARSQYLEPRGRSADDQGAVPWGPGQGPGARGRKPVSGAQGVSLRARARGPRCRPGPGPRPETVGPRTQGPGPALGRGPGPRGLFFH